MNGTINGIVLAGGLSSRMGRDKATLPWQGRTLLEHMRGLLTQAGAREVWISGNYPAFGGIPDRVPRCGPLGGLYSVAMQMPDEPAWVVPVDTPRLSAVLLQRLCLAGDTPCVVFADEPLPMRLQIDDHCRRVLQELIEDPRARRSLRALQERLGVTRLPLAPGDQALLLNCNTPSEWESTAP
ncbi:MULTISPECIES: molybdenum cofactor guanylyltransferase [Stenotrophomonas]|uniref:molybdenum cofactor guanylyltransferase n=1 Tax=Stenotrophomonas TaxID=40323 RepID=UPI00066A8B38|nr:MULTISPECIES: molybdenum cofactor guanylyltransferase [Stenotrophomonas]MBH1410708.1 molybdenum cofactor guanylyltransferase [Stenotrophomonas maltophilia]MBH1746790.1 molybdenum cofactor guanylyltransferase [Stenotrophomonas maltophilia]MBH1866813.1 molybdenum cofactor guanylyltransferase [Stenotrophomonas maltophilia]MDH1391070.1 molybdenum cofactor guanylyltransferase [Stenotrophomonas sp. GD03701]MDH1391927.1 molybdenum cofactor guanylyltransferase [Stenotrophomonas sp. GD03702]